jgi:hypothetical protein
MAVEPLRLLDARYRIGVGCVAGFAALERFEVGAPFRGNGPWITQERFVKIVDERRVAAGQLGRCRKLLE